MRKSIFVLILLLSALAIAGGLVFAYKEMRKERDLEAAAETPVISPSRVAAGPEGATVLKLDPATQQRLGLHTSLLTPGSASQELTAPARVLAGATLAADWKEIQSAQIALTTAQADYGRKRNLFENDQNTSASAVEIAEAALKQRQLACEIARDRFAAAWGQAMAREENLAAWARSLSRQDAALVRVDLMTTDHIVDLKMVRLQRQNGDDLAAARVLGPAPSTDATLAGQSLLCLVLTNASELVAGSGLLARFETGSPVIGVVLPRAAVIRHAGLAWVYVQIAPNTFARRPVALDHPHLEGWLVAGQWLEPVVNAGAQSLLSEEFKGSIQMRD